MNALAYQVAEETPRQYFTGTFRTQSPERTLEWVAPFLPAMGITRVANVTGLDRLGVPVVMVCRPNARSVSVSQGKGLTLAAARASGVMESIELHHAEHIDAPLRYASIEDMPPHYPIVDPETLARVRNRSLGRHTPILWMEGLDLMTRNSIWVPYDAVSLNTTAPQNGGGACFSATSNGLASGNHLLEALIHGICEVVERDATTLWYLSDRDAQAQSRINPATIDDPDCLEVLSKFTAAGMETMIWDITSDIGLPCILALITDGGRDPSQAQYTSIGYGCYLSRNIALLRALTEAAQSRLTLITGSRDDIFREEYEPVPLEEVESFRSLKPSTGPTRRFSAVASHPNQSLQLDLNHIVALLQSAGVEQAIAIDLSQPAFGIPVARVIVPGLEGPIPGMEGPRAGSGFTPGARAQRRLRRNA